MLHVIEKCLLDFQDVFFFMVFVVNSAAILLFGLGMEKENSFDLLYVGISVVMSTLPETNIAPENRPSQKETSIPTIHFQVLC